jgi:hypothetical protein
MLLERFLTYAWLFLGWFGVRKKAQFSHYYITSRYILAGCRFADRIRQVVIQDPLSVEASLLEWEASEIEYIAYGYRTLPISAFIDHSAWGVPLRFVSVRHHAKFYRLYSLRNHGVRELQNLFERDGILDYEPSRRMAKFDC